MVLQGTLTQPAAQVFNRTPSPSAQGCEMLLAAGDEFALAAPHLRFRRCLFVFVGVPIRFSRQSSVACPDTSDSTVTSSIQRILSKMSPKIYPSTNIPKLDADLQEVAKKPRREITSERTLPPTFPEKLVRTVQSDSLPSRRPRLGKPKQNDPDVAVVGAGWYFPRAATALAASGATQVAYEKNPHKIGKGQIGLTGKDDYFSIGRHREAQLMPDFTEAQLNRLPPVIRAIAEMPSYRALSEKRKIADAIADETGTWKDKRDKYDALDKSKRISKQELIHVKTDLIKVMQSHGALEIIPEEADIDLISARLDAGRAVFMASGQQVNLKKMGMNHLQGQTGFVQELLRGHPDTEAAIKAILDKQQKVTEWASKNDVPLEKVPVQLLPTVAIVGGGASARGNTLDVLDRVDSKLLHLVSIRPLPKARGSKPTPALDAARGKMAFQLTTGYVSELCRSKNEESIDLVRIFNSQTNNIDEVKLDFLVHTMDEQFPINKQAAPYEKASDLVTKKLQEHPATNALLRSRSIIPGNESTDITLRITEPFKFSLRDDEDLVNSIRNLIEKKNNGGLPIIFVTGDNFFTKSITLLAAHLGYTGKFIQLATPNFPEERSQHDALEEKLQGVRAWRDIAGRMIGDGTEYQGSGFKLSIQDPNGNFLAVEDVDILINATGKTQSIPLVEAMKEKGYIGTHAGYFGNALHTNNDKLEGWHNFFSPNREESADIESPTIKLNPYFGYSRSIEPWGWEETFKFGQAAQQLDGQSSADIRKSEKPAATPVESSQDGNARKRHSLFGARIGIATSSGAGPLATEVNVQGEIPASDRSAGPAMERRLAAATSAKDAALQAGTGGGDGGTRDE